jgi:hypothetical protein
MRRFLLLPILVACGLTLARAAEVLPPVPANYFNDYAGVVSTGTAQSLDAELRQFERTTSNQILVAIYPTMQTDSSIEDYTVRIAAAQTLHPDRLRPRGSAAGRHLQADHRGRDRPAFPAGRLRRGPAGRGQRDPGRDQGRIPRHRRGRGR